MIDVFDNAGRKLYTVEIEDVNSIEKLNKEQVIDYFTKKCLDLKNKIATTASGFKVPLAPFFGQLAVAPSPEFGRQNSKEPREFGGNLDCKEMVAGSKIYLPVWNDGALFSTGDGHAAQGDGG